jgi:deazaflavin-dependent oxidoreductase (nitroreductase family)
MTTAQTGNYPPKGLLLVAYRLPVYFYRLGLGGLLGGRFVLINHVGRKTGFSRQAVVEVVEGDEATGCVTVVAGYGPQTQWYRNLKAHPETTIQIGRQTYQVLAEFITPEEGEGIIVRYWHRYGKLTGRLFSMLGYTWDGTEAGARQIAREALRFVRFTPSPQADVLSE